MELRPAAKIVRNFGFLTVGKIFGDACTFLLFVILSRTFGQEGVGQYSFAVAFTGFFVVFSDFGLYNLSIKEMGRQAGPLGDYYGGIFSLRLILSLSVFAVLISVILFLPFSPETKLIIVLIGAFQLIYWLVNGFAAVFVAREEMHLAGFMEFSLRAATALVAIVVVLGGGNLVTALAALPAVAFGQLLVAYGIVTKKYGKVRPIASLWYLTSKLREAVPYALSHLLYPFRARVDVVLLGFFIDAAAVGIYNVAYRMVFLFLFLTYLAGVALFPLASKLYVNSREELETLYHKSLRLVILTGLPATAGLWLIAPDLIEFIFGKSFAESAVILRLLAWLLFLEGLKSILGILLMSCDRPMEKTRSEWTAAWVSILGNVVLIPTFGVAGAAFATLVSETLLVFLLVARIKEILGWPHVGSRLVMGLVGTASFCFPFWFLPSLPIALVIPISVIVYLGTLLLSQEIRRNELRTVLNLLNGASSGLESSSFFKRILTWTEP